MNEHCQKHKANTKEKPNMQISAINTLQKLGFVKGKIGKCQHREMLEALNSLAGRNLDAKR